MRSSLQKAEEEERRKTAPTEKLARECLNTGGITAEMWADILGVGVRRIQKWRSGEEGIPEVRQAEVIWAARDLIAKQRESIEREIDFWIRQTYGPGNF